MKASASPRRRFTSETEIHRLPPEEHLDLPELLAVDVFNP